MEKLAAQNARTMLVVQIETAEGVENAQGDRRALEEVDCLWVGHIDLSCSLGIPGEFDNPKFLEAIDAVIEAGRATNTSLGRLVPGCRHRHRAVPAGLRLHRVLGRCLGIRRRGGGWPVRHPYRLRGLRRAPCPRFAWRSAPTSRKPDGSPSFPEFDLSPLDDHSDIDLFYLEPEPEISASQLVDVDALILLAGAPRVGSDSLTPNGRLAMVARFGVGYDKRGRRGVHPPATWRWSSRRTACGGRSRCPS